MNIEIHNFTQHAIGKDLFAKAAIKTLEFLKVKEKTEISLALVGSGRMRKLNKMYRGKNRVTDVLSFGEKSVLPYLKKAFPRLKKEQAEEKFILPPDNVKRLGEIIICLPQAKKQAKKQGNSLEKELIILTVHGLLHLLGYEHEKDSKEKIEMQTAEIKILKTIK